MIVMVSGGFDILHIGHVRMIQSACCYGDVIVALNSDEWLKRKKGYVFMPWKERAEILEAIRGVYTVTLVDDRDGTVCEALRRIRPDYFVNGGDRISPNPKEHKVCQDLGIQELFGVGGEKVQSSSNLINQVKLGNHAHSI